MLIAIALCLVGMCFVAFASRRMGTDPHCGSCGYNLSGTLAAQGDFRCPECGNDRLGRTTTGRVARSPVRIGVGVGLIGCGILVGIMSQRNIDWVAHAPNALLPLIASVDAEAAFAEALRRDQVGELDQSARAGLINSGLRWYTSGQLPASGRELLIMACMAGRLSEEQQSALVEVAERTLSFQARSPVGVGESSAMMVGFDAAPLVPCTLKPLELTAQGETFELIGEAHADGDSWSQTGLRQRVFHQLGEVPLQIKADLTICGAVHSVQLTQVIEVIEVEGARIRTERRSASIDQAVADGVRIWAASVGSPDWAGENGYIVSMQVNVGPLPVSVAFRLYARVGSATFRFWDKIRARAGGGTGGGPYSYPTQLPESPKGAIEVLMLPSAKAAKDHVDIHAVWPAALLFTFPEETRHKQHWPGDGAAGRVISLEEAIEWLGHDFAIPTSDVVDPVVDWTPLGPVVGP